MTAAADAAPPPPTPPRDQHVPVGPVAICGVEPTSALVSCSGADEGCDPAAEPCSDGS